MCCGAVRAWVCCYTATTISRCARRSTVVYGLLVWCVHLSMLTRALHSLAPYAPRPTSTLRCMIPSWATDRVLRHVTLVHQQESASAGPAFNRVRVWSCRYIATSLVEADAEARNEGTPVVVHGLVGSSLNGSLAWIMRQDPLPSDEPDVVEVKVGSIGTRIKLEPKHLRPIDLTPRWYHYRNDFNHIEEAPVRQRSNPEPGVASLTDWAEFATLCASCVEVSGAIVENQGASITIDQDLKNGAASNILSLAVEFFPGLDTLAPEDTTIVPSPRGSPRGSPGALAKQQQAQAQAQAQAHAKAQAQAQAQATQQQQQQEQQQQGLSQINPIRTLLEHDPEPDLTEHEGTVEIMQIAQTQLQPAPQTVMHLVKNGNTAVHWAAWKNHTTLLQQLLSNGQSASHPNRSGQTALHWAAKRGSIQASKILLGQGALLTACDSLGKTAEDVARERGFPELADVLRNAAATQRAAIAQANAGGGGGTDGMEAYAKAFDVLLYEETLEGGLGAYDDGSGSSATALAAELGYERVRSLTIRRAEGEKLGLRLQASKEHAGTLACKIAEGGAAQRAGVIKDGDLIVTIQFKSVFELTHKELIAMIGQAGPSLEINVVTPAEDDFKFLALEEASTLPRFQGGGSGHAGLAAPGLPASPPPPPPQQPQQELQQSPAAAVSPPSLNQQQRQPPSPDVAASAIRAPARAASPAPAPALTPQQQQPPQSQPQQPRRRASTPVPAAKLVNLSNPDLETSTTVQYKIPDVEFNETKSLRITLPSWACTRVLRHVRVLHRKGPDGWKGFVATGDQMQDIEPTFQSVRAWGFCLSTNGGTQYLVPGATAMLHAFNQCELDGHLVTVLQVMDKGRFDVQLKISGKRLVTSLDHLRGIQGDAQYYEFNGKTCPDLGYREALGVAVPYVDPDTPVETCFEDWNASIGVLHAGAIELATSQGVAVVSGVEIEFFPAHVPSYAGGVPISVDEQIYSTGTQFIPLLSGLPGLVEKARFGSVHFNLLDEERPLSSPSGTPWCLGSGWISNGSRLVAVQERREGQWRVDGDGVFRIPLRDGFRVLSIEVAVRDYTGAGTSGTNQSTGTIWCKFSRQGGDFVFRRTDVCGNVVLSGGPQTNDHVSIEGDELLVGTDLAPAWLLGYRITYCASDPAIKDINFLRHTKAREQRDVELMATQLLHTRTKDGLMVEARVIRAPDDTQDTLGSGTFGSVLKVQTCLGKTYALKPFKPVAGLIVTSGPELFECASKLASYTNNDNVASIRGVCTASDYADDPLETIPYLMLELFPLRSLRDALDKESLPVDMQLEILCGVCSGMYHLHTHTLLPICHGDLKASNVMLRNDFTPCISDFGLARFKLPGGPVEARQGAAAVLPACVAGSIPWMAPELLAGSTFAPTKATDVYAFAMLMYETMTQQIPWSEIDCDEVVVEKVMEGLRPVVVAGDHVRTLMQQRQEDCCCHDRLQRQVSFLGIRTWLHHIHRIVNSPHLAPPPPTGEQAGVGKGGHDGGANGGVTDGEQDSNATSLEDKPWRRLLATSDESDNCWAVHKPSGVLYCDTGCSESSPEGGGGGGGSSSGDSNQVALIQKHTLEVMAAGSAGRADLYDVNHVVALCDFKGTSFFEFLLRVGVAWINNDHKDWQSESNFVRCGGDVFSSPSVFKSRSMGWARLFDPHEYVSFGSGTFLETPQVHVVYVAAETVEAAWQHVATGFKSAERNGSLGYGVYASHDIQDTKAHIATPRTVGGVQTVVVAAYMVLVDPYPVTATEMPGKRGQLAGRRVTPGYGAHVAFVQPNTSSIHPTPLWEAQTPSTMVMVERHLLLPFAIVPPTPQ